MKKYFILLTLAGLFSMNMAWGQERAIDEKRYFFKDTVFNIAFDSLVHNLGFIKPTNEHRQLVKHLKYVGTDTISIVRAWTGDPHFICSYPKDPLIPNKIYPITICFAHRGRQGTINKAMGFTFSDGNRITYKFKGEYLPVPESKN